MAKTKPEGWHCERANRWCSNGHRERLECTCDRWANGGEVVAYLIKRSDHDGHDYCPANDKPASTDGIEAMLPIRLDQQPRGEDLKPDWQLNQIEALAVNISLAMHKHVAGWGGATDEQLELVAREIIASVYINR